MARPGRILIAVADGVLADSLRFSLELEGFEVNLCDERGLDATTMGCQRPGCIVLDQDVFERMLDGDRHAFAPFAVPSVLMVSQRTSRVLDRARVAGIDRVVEKPLLGATLSDAIRLSLGGLGPCGGQCGNCRCPT